MSELTKFLEESKEIERDARSELAEITCSMSIPNALDDLAKLRKMVEVAVKDLTALYQLTDERRAPCDALAELERLAKGEK